MVADAKRGRCFAEFQRIHAAAIGEKSESFDACAEKKGRRTCAGLGPKREPTEGRSIEVGLGGFAFDELSDDVHALAVALLLIDFFSGADGFVFRHGSAHFGES